MQELRRLGAIVETFTPEAELISVANLRLDHDLYLWKSHGALANSIAAYVTANGGRLLNTYESTMQVRDKLLTAKRLMNAGIPTPEAYVTSDLTGLKMLAGASPIVVKPNHGHRGQGITIARRPADLDGRYQGEQILFAQRYVSGDGRDLKAYAIGQQTFGVKRVFPARTLAEKQGEAYPLTDELDDIVLRCGEVFGLDLYGVDIIETAEGPFVLELNCWPGYKGVPHAARLLADYIYNYTKDSTRSSIS